jgi:hypothetical protein
VGILERDIPDILGAGVNGPQKNCA